MRGKRVMACLLAACMIAAPVGGSTVYATGTDTAGEVEVVEVTGSETVSPNDLSEKISLFTAAEDADGYISYDFESEEAGSNWGVTGDSAISDNTKVVADADTGNQYLQLCRYKEAKGKKLATKAFENVPLMNSATISFDWYTTELKSESKTGALGLSLQNDGKEIVALYYKEIRDPGNTTGIFYSTYGKEYSEWIDTGVDVEYGSKHLVEINVDFVTHLLDVSIDGSEVISDVAFDMFTNKIDTLVFGQWRDSKKHNRVDMGIDNFCMNWQENTGEDTVSQLIYSLEELPDIKVSAAEWAAYQHPTALTATLVSGETIEVPIDGNTWTSEPAFSAETAERGWYTWTADIVAPKEHANPSNLKASYRLGYTGTYVSTRDYEEDFTFGLGSFVDAEEKPIAWGKAMDSSAGTGTVPLTWKSDDSGNSYMEAGLTEKKERGSRLDLASGFVKGATVTFDWKPVNCSDGAKGELMFLAQDSWNSYFILNFGSDYLLKYYTKCPLTKTSTTQAEFTGAIAEDAAVSTGLGAKDTWYNVELKLDYITHTADIKIVDKNDATKVYTAQDIPVDTQAGSLNSMVIHVNQKATMGLDNITVDYEKFGEKDIVSLEELKNVKVAKTAFDSYEWPKEIKATLGNGKSATVLLGEWTAEPAFDKEVEAVYTWTAPLVSDELLNDLNLKATFEMDYTLLPFPLYVHNPNALELEFGESWSGELPTEVMAFMSDESTEYMSVGEWTAIREFNPNEEGIYVYGANILAEEGKNQIVEDQLMKNEQHVVGYVKDDEGEKTYIHDEETYVYDVYFRINYFESESNYNAYQRSMEYLDRGVYAIATEEGVFLSWRLLVTEYGENVAFNIYRNGELVNAEPIANKTNYVDVNGKAGDCYTVTLLQNGMKSESQPVTALDKEYMSIPVQKPDPLPNSHDPNYAKYELAEYRLNDAGVADVDADGQYEVIVKWYPSNAFDSGKAGKRSAPTIFDVYEMDGTPLWRLNTGLEMPSGAHFNQFIFYDLDEDGKAELFIKTSDGSVTYRPNAEGKFDMTDESTIVSYVGDKSVVVGSGVNDNGHADARSNEYVTVFNGQTGEVISTVDYVNTTGEFTDWGDSYGNRSARYNMAIAYLPKASGSTETIPAVLFNRGYYQKTTVAAYTLRDGMLNLEWNFVAENDSEYAGRGNHNMSTGDLDNDGFDELVIGAMALDHDGSVLWVKDGKEGRDEAGHADAIHLSKMLPDSDQLYVFAPQEEGKVATLNYYLTNAANGARIAGNFMAPEDVGRGIAANITPSAGFEYWAGVPNSEIPDEVPSGAIYNVYGDVVAQIKPKNFTTNWRMYWDGDLLSELPDSHNPSKGHGTPTIFKYNWENNTMDALDTFEGTMLNNSTKNTPCLAADLFGDWREEMMVRTEDDSELRIYMTTKETDYMIYTLMHDPVYRNAVANQNTSYNQPPHLGYYLGEDIAEQVLAMQLPTSKVVYTTEGPALVPDDNTGNEEQDKPEGDNTGNEEQDKSEDNTGDGEQNVPENNIGAEEQGKLEDNTGDGEQDVSEDNTEDEEQGEYDEEEDEDDSSDSTEVAKDVEWNQVSKDLVTADAKHVGNVNVDVVVGDKIIVPSNVLQVLAGRDTTLALHTGRHITFSLSGVNVTQSNKSLDFSVRKGNINASAMQVAGVLQNAVDSLHIPMVKHDSFDMLANLHVGLGSENAGKYANLYVYSEYTKSLVYLNSFRITENGQAMFGLFRGADYLVTVTDAPITYNKVNVMRLLYLNPNIKDRDLIFVGKSLAID